MRERLQIIVTKNQISQMNADNIKQKLQLNKHLSNQ
jgi:negative regulator of genetic competence, sporulation and motility